MSDSYVYRAKRRLAVQIAKRLGESQLRGNSDNAGPQIERFLRLFRSEFNRNEGTSKYSDLNEGFGWCGCFIYYCFQHSGFRFDPKPSGKLRTNLALGSMWKAWALLEENGFYVSSEDLPEVGDIVVLSKSISDIECDHLGIVVDEGEDHLTMAEGDVQNSTGIFSRSVSPNANCYVRLTKY